MRSRAARRPRASFAASSFAQTDERYPLCIYETASLGDVDLTVRLKPVAGRVDRAGGLILRVQDANNYYVVRANALEDNVRLYRVVNRPPHRVRRR